jgi:hypothetical protein
MLNRVIAGSQVAMAVTSVTMQDAIAPGHGSPDETGKQPIEGLGRTMEDLNRRLSRQEIE